MECCNKTDCLFANKVFEVLAKDFKEYWLYMVISKYNIYVLPQKSNENDGLNFKQNTNYKNYNQ